MTRVFASPRVFVFSCAVALSLLVSPRAFADDDDPIITSAVPTVSGSTTTLTITGRNLDTRAPEHVLLNGQALTPVAQSDTRIVVTMPSSVLATPGTYLLVVGHGSRHFRFDDDYVQFDVTVGAAGPQGVPGLTGATGATGPAGATGATGAQGLVGPAGSIGPIGLSGPVGPIGPSGPVGPIGPTGPTGATGAQGPAGVAGAAGATGAQGPQGLQGAQGAPGTAGAAGGSTIQVLSQSQMFTASGTWTAPAGIAFVQVRLQGAGGTGGDADGAGISGGFAGGGGGGGGFVQAVVPVTPGTPYPVVVGIVGNGGNPSCGDAGGFKAATRRLSVWSPAAATAVEQRTAPAALATSSRAAAAVEVR